MKNKEKFAKEIMEIACKGSKVALVENKIFPCKDISCRNCDFNNTESCCKNCEKWCESEYVEPPIDWSEVKVNTPLLVSDDNERWHRRYFAKYYEGKVYSFADGTTSWSSTSSPFPWNYAKLFNSDSENIDWTKIPIDTPILVRDYDDCIWVKRYFAGHEYESNRVRAWNNGDKSYSNSNYTMWNHAILYEGNELLEG